MRITRTTAYVVLIPLLAVRAHAQDAAPPSFQALADALGKAKVNLVQAIDAAQAESKGGALVGAKLAPAESSLWVIKFLAAGQIREVLVSAEYGRVFGVESRDVRPEHEQWATKLPESLKKSSARVVEAVKLAESQTRAGRAHAFTCRPDAGHWYCDVSLWTPDKTVEARIRLGADEAANWNFDDATAGQAPKDWSIRQTKPTTALATWKVVADPAAPSMPNVLALTETSNFDGTFNLAVADKTAFKDLDLTVKVKAVSGKEDQGGGPIWRCKDENNYYICRFNPLESNFRVYYVKDGVRKQLESAKIETEAGRWYTIRVTMTGPHIACHLDGKKLLEADDSTFPDAGMVGLWTKADAVTSFDDLTVGDLPSDPPFSTKSPGLQSGRPHDQSGVPEAANQPTTQPTASGGEVVIYCSVDVTFARPILDEFAGRTGLKVHPVFDTEAGKTTGLVNKLLAEKAAPRADVWWSGEVFGTMQLAAAGVLAPYKSPVAAEIPDRYKQSDGLWTAFGLRGRVLAYNPKRTKKEDLPRRWCDLVDPEYKGRFRMADPRFGTTRGHMATLLTLWGPQAMTDFYRGLRANDCKLTDGNSQAVLLLSRGMADIVATDTDDVIVAKERGDSIDMIYPDLDAPAPVGAGPTSKPTSGTLWIPNSVALVAGSPHADAGRRLIDYLVSAEIEERLHASESRNVPVRPALRIKLNAEAPGEANADYAAAAAMLDRSDELVRDVLLQ
jgi:iron(III) transport system substrate-binding protein